MLSFDKRPIQDNYQVSFQISTPKLTRCLLFMIAASFIMQAYSPHCFGLYRSNRFVHVDNHSTKA